MPQQQWSDIVEVYFEVMLRRTAPTVGTGTVYACLYDKDEEERIDDSEVYVTSYNTWERRASIDIKNKLRANANLEVQTRVSAPGVTGQIASARLIIVQNKYIT